MSFAFPTGVRWILFDAVGTLLYADPPVADAYHSIALQFGSRLSTAEIAQRFAAAFSSEFGGLSGANILVCRGLTRSPTSETAEVERWRRVVADVLYDVPDAGGEPFELLWTHFAQGTSWRLFGDVAPALAELFRRGYRLGIASNFDSRLHEIVRSHPPLAHGMLVFASSEVGFSKPDPRFFAAVQAQLGAAADEILLVGDDLENDYEGALAAGWRAVLLARDEAATAPNRIQRLTELLV